MSDQGRLIPARAFLKALGAHELLIPMGGAGTDTDIRHLAAGFISYQTVAATGVAVEM